jgi:folate-binding protein YgfZ
MGNATYAWLDDRAVLAVAGEDRRTFLQGLVSNDVNKVSAARAIHAAFLTAQGKYLHDFFIADAGGAFLLETEKGRLGDLKRRLGLYKLRSKVMLEERPEMAVVAAIGDGVATALGLAAEVGTAREFAGGVAFVDPRLAAAGVRVVARREVAGAALAAAGLVEGGRDGYETIRLSLGLPDGSRDLTVEKAILLENGFDELNGVDWQKGCYLGQELTARTKYRLLVRKRLLPVVVEGPLPAPGTPVTLDGEEAGEMRSGLGGLGLALLRLEAVEKAAVSGKPLTAGAARLVVWQPDWLRLPAAAD